LTVGETVNPDISRMTIVVEGDYRTLEQVVKQLRKLIVTIKVEDFSERAFISSELLMVKISAPPVKRSEIMDIVEVFSGKVVDITSDTLTIRFTGETALVDDVIEVLKPYGIKETARTGALALGRE
jgi:acetolactate synthase-1/3 small subunit